MGTKFILRLHKADEPGAASMAPPPAQPKAPRKQPPAMAVTPAFGSQVMQRPPQVVTPKEGAKVAAMPEAPVSAAEHAKVSPSAAGALVEGRPARVRGGVGPFSANYAHQEKYSGEGGKGSRYYYQVENPVVDTDDEGRPMKDEAGNPKFTQRRGSAYVDHPDEAQPFLTVGIHTTHGHPVEKQYHAGQIKQDVDKAAKLAAFRGFLSGKFAADPQNAPFAAMAKRLEANGGWRNPGHAAKVLGEQAGREFSKRMADETFRIRNYDHPALFNNLVEGKSAERFRDSMAAKMGKESFEDLAPEQKAKVGEAWKAKRSAQRSKGEGVPWPVEDPHHVIAIQHFLNKGRHDMFQNEVGRTFDTPTYLGSDDRWTYYSAARTPYHSGQDTKDDRKTAVFRVEHTQPGNSKSIFGKSGSLGEVANARANARNEALNDVKSSWTEKRRPNTHEMEYEIGKRLRGKGAPGVHPEDEAGLPRMQMMTGRGSAWENVDDPTHSAHEQGWKVLLHHAGKTRDELEAETAARTNPAMVGGESMGEASKTYDPDLNRNPEKVRKMLGQYTDQGHVKQASLALEGISPEDPETYGDNSGIAEKLYHRVMGLRHKRDFEGAHHIEGGEGAGGDVADLMVTHDKALEDEARLAKVDKLRKPLEQSDLAPGQRMPQWNQAEEGNVIDVRTKKGPASYEVMPDGNFRRVLKHGELASSLPPAEKGSLKGNPVMGYVTRALADAGESYARFHQKMADPLRPTISQPDQKMAELIQETSDARKAAEGAATPEERAAATGEYHRVKAKFDNAIYNKAYQIAKEGMDRYENHAMEGSVAASNEERLPESDLNSFVRELAAKHGAEDPETVDVDRYMNGMRGTPMKEGEGGLTYMDLARKAIGNRVSRYMTNPNVGEEARNMGERGNIENEAMLGFNQAVKNYRNEAEYRARMLHQKRQPIMEQAKSEAMDWAKGEAERQAAMREGLSPEQRGAYAEGLMDKLVAAKASQIAAPRVASLEDQLKDEYKGNAMRAYEGGINEFNKYAAASASGMVRDKLRKANLQRMKSESYDSPTGGEDEGRSLSETLSGDQFADASHDPMHESYSDRDMLGQMRRHVSDIVDGLRNGTISRRELGDVPLDRWEFLKNHVFGNPEVFDSGYKDFPSLVREGVRLYADRLKELGLPLRLPFGKNPSENKSYNDKPDKFNGVLFKELAGSPKMGTHRNLINMLTEVKKRMGGHRVYTDVRGVNKTTMDDLRDTHLAANSKPWEDMGKRLEPSAEQREYMGRMQEDGMIDPNTGEVSPAHEAGEGAVTLKGWLDEAEKRGEFNKPLKEEGRKASLTPDQRKAITLYQLGESYYTNLKKAEAERHARTEFEKLRAGRSEGLLHPDTVKLFRKMQPWGGLPNWAREMYGTEENYRKNWLENWLTDLGDRGTVRIRTPQEMKVAENHYDKVQKELDDVKYKKMRERGLRTGRIFQPSESETERAMRQAWGGEVPEGSKMAEGGEEKVPWDQLTIPEQRRHGSREEYERGGFGKSMDAMMAELSTMSAALLSAYAGKRAFESKPANLSKHDDFDGERWFTSVNHVRKTVDENHPQFWGMVNKRYNSLRFPEGIPSPFEPNAMALMMSNSIPIPQVTDEHIRQGSTTLRMVMDPSRVEGLDIQPI